MSVEEDTELRDLISQTLQANGCFAKIRAQLRASIYLALDEDDTFQKKELLLNKKLHSVLETVEGKLMFCIVREFLEHFDLEFTISVFDPESYMGLDYDYAGRYKLIEDLNIPNVNQESSVPVLLQLLQLCKSNENSSNLQHTESSVTSLNYKNDLLSQNTLNDNNSIIQATNDSDNSSKLSSNSLVNDNLLNETFDVTTKHNFELNTQSLLSLNKVDNIDNFKVQQAQDFNQKLLINFDTSLHTDSIPNKNDLEKSRVLDQPVIEADFSTPVVKDSKLSKFDTSFDKLKLPSPKSDKIKVKNNLTSLSDLPPLQMTKSRTNDMLLPSLYTKEFKDKTNAKDVDKLFELEPLDNYEEDFISENEIDLSIKSNQDELSKPNSLLELQGDRHAMNKNLLLENETSICSDLYGKKKVYLDNNSTASSVTSEDFEINSNVDDILNSC